MPARSQPESDTTLDQPPASRIDIAAYESRPGRFVFLEDGNTDGWIATDVVVDFPS